jgi:S1-C subfamily serine protease
VIIAMVKPGSSAQNAHLQLNDVVTQINRTPVTDIEQFKKLYQDFRKASPHEAVVLETLRGVNTEVIRIEPPQ